MAEAATDFTGIVVAAGRGSRFGGAMPKQFLRLNGRSLLDHAVAALASGAAVRGVVVVLPDEALDGPAAAAIRRRPEVLDVVAGGASRAESVTCGLAAAGQAPFVLVHDAARPLASPALVARVIDATRAEGAAVPVLVPDDSVKEVDTRGRLVGTLDRSRVRLAQTPQGARLDWLAAALARALGSGARPPDEVAALEAAGYPVALVPGDPSNLKITRGEDLERAERLGAGGAMALRVGSGFDIHRLGADRPLVLGGVVFPGQPGLIGHSDADVVLHAAMDALLGAVGLGDIGAHFPPGDERWAGADSVRLAARVAELLAERGHALVHLDLTLLAERPRIRERAGEMREAIAVAFGVNPERVSLKATTLEGLGALGRGEGIACQAIATVALGRIEP